MKNKNFTHLHLHTQYSVLDGYGSAEAYVKKAKELGFESLGVTDHSSIDSCIEFQNACDEHGIKPILGCEPYIVPDMLVKEERGYAHISIWVKNIDGWHTLLRLLTEANTNGFYYKPRMDFKTILESDLTGLIFGTACAGSFIKMDGGLDFLRALEKKTEVYYEIMPHDIDIQDELHTFMKDSIGFPLDKVIMTNDCHYPDKEDSIIQEILLAIQTKKKWNDPERFSFGFNGLHLRTVDEMHEAMTDLEFFSEEQIDASILNTQKIVDQCCDFRIPKQEIYLPMPPAFEGLDSDEVLLDLCKQGLVIMNKENDEKYIERYREEYELICKKNFSKYFLIVYDLVNWCAENNILVGPGRGCFLPDSIVDCILNDEIIQKKIQDIEIGDKVISHDGSIQPVIDTLEYDCDEIICEIEVEDGRVIKCTKDHEIFTEEGWIEASKLKEGDKIIDFR